MSEKLPTRKFYRTVFEVEILSECPSADEWGPEDIVHQMTDGEASGRLQVLSHKQVSPKRMVALLEAQASSPEFLGLCSDGQNDRDHQDYPPLDPEYPVSDLEDYPERVNGKDTWGWRCDSCGHVHLADEHTCEQMDATRGTAGK